jgi:glycosyltransferase involved in cell wall biosynthesis
MKLLFLSKRRPQNRDLLTNPYGRFYHLPKYLSELGHDVHLVLADYKKGSNHLEKSDEFSWYSYSIRNHTPLSYFSKANALIKAIQPDLIIGFSDTWFGILAENLGRKYQIPSLIDAYDNYESYIPWCKPLHWAWRRSVSRATMVTAAGPGLAELLSKDRPGRPAEVIPMAADPGFQPMDKRNCRLKIGLPEDKVLIGYSGSIHPNYETNFLFTVFSEIRNRIDNVEFVLSGRFSDKIKLPKNICYLGYRPSEEIPYILNSLDLACIYNVPGAFGNFSYPSKLFEAMSCGIPVVASDLPGINWMLKDHPQLLAKPGDIDDFVSKALRALTNDKVKYSRTGSWEESASLFEKAISEYS